MSPAAGRARRSACPPCLPQVPAERRPAHISDHHVCPACHVQLGIYEALKVKRSGLLSATEAAEMILRVDDIIKAAPRQRQ